MDGKGLKHIPDRPLHPQTQGKIERYQQSMKNVVKLDDYYYPKELAAALETVVHYYNHKRYYKSLNNVTPADGYFGIKEQILKQRVKIKHPTLLKRRRLYQKEKLVNTQSKPYKTEKQKHYLNLAQSLATKSRLSFDVIQHIK